MRTAVVKSCGFSTHHFGTKRGDFVLFVLNEVRRHLRAKNGVLKVAVGQFNVYFTGDDFYDHWREY